jgi:predicted AlkP superfamily phosphohydrolase/phosphomutase
MNKKDSKVLVIGLDGATWDLIKPWVDEGRLSNISNLMKRGVWGNLKSVIPTLSAPAWVSFMTGKNPGKHGIFDFMVYSGDSHFNDEESSLVSSRSLKDKTIWEILSLHNKKVGVVNVPVTYPPKKVNGFLISGFMTPPSAKEFTYPKELKEEIPDYRIGTKFERYWHGMEPEDKLMLFEEQHDITEKRAFAVLKLMDKKDTDFLIVVFKGTDNMQHYFWDRKDVLLEYYQKIDEIIGEILAKAGKNVNYIIMSDHGFGPAATKIFYINLWLGELGLFRTKQATKKYLWSFVCRIGRKFPKRVVRTSLVKKTASDIREMSIPQIDWSETKAYGEDRGLKGININVKGREPYGIVGQEMEYEDLRNKIVDELNRLKDPETGEKIMNEVYKNNEIYSGEFLDKTSDIIFIQNHKYLIKQDLLSGTMIASHSPELPGEHHAQINGIFIAKGPDVKEGKKIEEAELVDLAPTILHLMTVPVSKDMDGKVLKEIFREDSEPAKRPIVYKEIDEKKKIEAKIEKLKNVGKL